MGISDQSMKKIYTKVFGAIEEGVLAFLTSLSWDSVALPCPVDTYSHPTCFSKVSSADHPFL